MCNMNVLLSLSILLYVCVSQTSARLPRDLARHVERAPEEDGDFYRRLPRLPRKKTCSNSLQCTKRKQCCRNTDGTLLDPQEGQWGSVQGGSTATNIGTCSSSKSGPRKVCSLTCGCVEGYTCYRTVTGMCCPPRTCWKKKDAERDRKFWANCRPPTCFLPPSANPGSGGPLRI